MTSARQRGERHGEGEQLEQTGRERRGATASAFAPYPVTHLPYGEGGDITRARLASLPLTRVLLVLLSLRLLYHGPRPPADAARAQGDHALPPARRRDLPQGPRDSLLVYVLVASHATPALTLPQARTMPLSRALPSKSRTPMPATFSSSSSVSWSR